MRNEMQIFENSEFGKVRTIEKNNEVWFVGKDVAEILGYSDTVSALKQHCKGVVKHHIPHPQSINKTIEVSIIPERDVYRLIMRSKLPTAEKFEEWVVGDVLPSIRKHGGYLTPQKIEEALLSPDTIIRLATDLKAEREKRLQAEKQIELDKPKVIFAEAVEASVNSILIRDMAKLLNKNGINIGEKRLYQWLRDNNFVQKTCNKPTQKAVDLGVLKLDEGFRFGKDKELIPYFTTKVTGKGQIYFINKFKKVA